MIDSVAMAMEETAMQEWIPEDSAAPTTKSTPLRLSYETRVFGGRYRVRRPIGRGQVADVYLGDDLLLERVVAIKIPHQSVLQDAARLERFRREAISLATVRSPHIVGIYDIGLTHEGAYLVMQHIEGRTIEEEIRRFGPMTQLRATTVITQLLAGLSAMQGQGLESRDIRSSNVLLDRNDKVVLLDLGIVSDARRAMSTVVGHGTPTDPAGEGLSENELASNVYQVGLIMLFLMTGIDSARRSPRVGYEDLLQRLPATFARVARRALDTDPIARFASTIAMKEAIETALHRSVAGEASPEQAPRGERHPHVRDCRPTVTMTAAHLLSLLTDSRPTSLAKSRVELGIKTAELEAAQIVSAAPLVAPIDCARILIVDEDRQFRNTSYRMLANAYHVLLAPGAEQAQAHIDAGARFDVILCGLSNPVPFHSLLLAAVPGQAAALVFLTDSTQGPDVHAFLERITNRRLSKPLEAVPLRRAITEQIACARRAADRHGS